MVGAGRGQQPYEGYLSTVCEAFGCTPDVAKRQDRAEVEAILDYRAARMAVELSKKPEGLDGYPELADMLDEMRAAQTDVIEGN